MINKERLKETFLELVTLDSPSQLEGLAATYVKQRLEILGIAYEEDQAGKKIKGDSGNLIAWVDGPSNEEPILLNAHLDTVQRPGEKVKVHFEDGIFKSDGNTILGADDKSGIAIILEILEVIKEKGIRHRPIQPVFTVCEEIGLLGAKNLDYSLIKTPWGLILDGGNPSEIINRAPMANRFLIEVMGKEAHAGLHPEEGVNAIFLASKAIGQISWGRIDEETTCNVGTIEGGKATNIVPAKTIVKGEVRSHSQEKLGKQTNLIMDTFKKTSPLVNIDVIDDYPLMVIEEGHPLIKLIKEAGEKVGVEIVLKITGGGSDANIFNSKGIVSVIMGTGMKKVHTKEEYIDLNDMVKSANLLLNIIAL